MIGVERVLPLPMEGSLPPDLQGTFFRIGPARFVTRRGRGEPATDDDGGGGGGRGDHAGGGQRRGALHAVELREGKAVSYLRTDSDADAGVFWHGGSVLALPEAGIPSRYSRLLEREAFDGDLTVPIASHVHRVSSSGGRVLFAVDHGGGVGPRTEGEVEVDGNRVGEGEGTFLRIGEWDASGGLRTAQSVELEHGTWQHDIGVTAGHVVFIESPTRRLRGGARDDAVPFRWVPGSEGWAGVVRRGGDGRDVRWFRLDPCLVTHVLGAYEERREPDRVVAGGDAEAAEGSIVVFACCYAAPEVGQPVVLAASVVAPAGIGLTTIGGSLGVLERWRIVGEDIERTVVDERHVEYPRIDPACDATSFRYGYALEMARARDRSGVGARGPSPSGVDGDASPVGLLKFDLDGDAVAAWDPGPGRRPSEPVFVRAGDGHGDDEGWLLTIVDDVDRGASDLYVLDASSMGRPRPEAVIHLPERMPLRSHGEWVPADRYR
ncbi:MAG: carotenoid oxygenase family protein [Acidimicrobiales bacterium]